MIARKVKLEKHKKTFTRESDAKAFCQNKQLEGYNIDYCLLIDCKWRIFYWRFAERAGAIRLNTGRGGHNPAK